MRCEVCGKEIERSSYANAVLCSSECYTINFWNEKIALKDHKQVARINGVHYWIEERETGFKGFDGAKHTIQFNDGRIVETDNLWTQGAIPEKYREALPDNAKFI